MRLQYQHEFILPLQKEESLRTALNELEAKLITDALDLAEGNKSQAAAFLNVRRTTMLAAMKRLKIL